MKLEFAPFPKSKQEPFLVTSPPTSHYNCIAWAYGDNTKWFWPDSQKIYFWPNDIPRVETIEAFIKLFENIGYSVCENGEIEREYHKIAIYQKNNIPTHAARQLENGLWTSKLGEHFDVTHSISSMSDGFYGNVGVFMKRKK